MGTNYYNRRGIYSDEEMVTAYMECGTLAKAAERLKVSGETIARAVRRSDIYTPEKVCACCGEKFIAHNMSRQYCSRRCKDVAYKRSKGQDSRLEPYRRKCVVCGQEFETHKQVKKTCSIECSEAWRRLRPCSYKYKYRKQGEHTADEYREIRRKQAEQRAEVKAIEKAWYKALHTVERECAECGALFYCLDSESNVTCSPECSRRWKNKRADKRIPKSQRVDRITLKKLFKRDGGKCYLCGGQCDFDDWKTSAKGNLYQGDNYPTIEHVVPISKGGLDAWDNVRLAHWKCNLDKADGVIKIQPMSKQFAYSEKYSKTQAKKTAQYTLDGKLIRIWESTGQIRRELGLNDKHIQSVCRGHKSKTGNAYGYHWEYIVEHEDVKLKGAEHDGFSGSR